MNSKSKVFLGGTCNGSTWREKLKPLLKTRYFDPVVDDWTHTCIAIEDKQKNDLCDIHLYVITSASTSVYSIAEAVESAHDESKVTIFHVIQDGFSEEQLKHLRQVATLIRRHRGYTSRVLDDFDDLASLIDSCAAYDG